MDTITYLVENEADAEWGLTVCSVGYEKIVPDMEYPTPVHNPSYVFSKNTGRILAEYQLVYIPEGTGLLKTATGGEFKIYPGCLFLLFPGEWHTYYPDKKTGWTQYWMGFKGKMADAWVEKGFFRKKNPVFYAGFREEIIRLYHKAVGVAREENPYSQPVLAGLAAYLAGLTYQLDKLRHLKADKKSLQQIQQARIIIRHNLHTDVSFEKLAQEVGMGYSNFRKHFKNFTGSTPAQYLAEIRLQTAKELLYNTSLSIKEIAYKTGYSSPDYFSARFKRKTGYSPCDLRMGKIAGITGDKADF